MRDDFMFAFVIPLLQYSTYSTVSYTHLDVYKRQGMHCATYVFHEFLLACYVPTMKTGYDTNTSFFYTDPIRNPDGCF